MFTLAVHALPFFVGTTLALAAYSSGSGAITAFLAGLIVGLVTLGIAQIAFAAVHSAPIRTAIALVFAAPAALAGYHMVLGLARVGGTTGVWQEALAIVGAIVVGGTAWARLGHMHQPASEQGSVASSVRSPSSLRLRDQIRV
jgi:hypothetical protein